jgi:hypothetical protein
MGKEILRTDLYERGSGQEYVYVKFRCARCKRIAQTFVPASSWDWRRLEPPAGEMSADERDRLLEEEPVHAEDLLSFHEDMARIDTLSQLSEALRLGELAPAPIEGTSTPRPRRRTRVRRERAHDAKAAQRESKRDAPRDAKRKDDKRAERGKDLKDKPDAERPGSEHSEHSEHGGEDRPSPRATP